MRNIIIGILLLASISSCCKEENLSDFHCEVKNPIEDLDWLRIKIKEDTTSKDSIKVEEMTMPTFNETGFLYQYAAPGLPWQKYYYTCNGALICYDVGGFTGTDCTDQMIDGLEIGKTIYISY